MTEGAERCWQFPNKRRQSHMAGAESLSNKESLPSPALTQDQSNLGRRAKKSRGVTTTAEITFCADFVLSGNVRQASLQAGRSARWGYKLLKTPRIQSVLREFEKRKEASNSAKSRAGLTRERLDELFMQRLVNMMTDPTVGDSTIVNMFETAYKRAGTAEAKAGGSAQKAQIYARRLYLPPWRKEVIERSMKKDIEAGREPTGLVPVTGGDQ